MLPPVRPAGSSGYRNEITQVVGHHPGGAGVGAGHLLPLLRRTVNIRTVELSGLELDLQRNAEGITNWDDLIATTSTRTTTEEEAGDAEVTTEVEGNTATIAALAVGGIDISNATVRWTDAQAGVLPSRDV